MKKQLILFDGICIFCDSFINFIVKRDKKHALQLAFLQSEIAEELSEKYNFEKNLNSMILIEDERVFYKSDAIIRILSNLGFPYSIGKILLLIPQKLRNYFYDFFGKNRYKWFGKKEKCESENSQIKSRII